MAWSGLPGRSSQGIVARSFLSFVGEGKERVADPQERLRGRLCMEGGPYKFKTRFYFRQFEHFLLPLLLTSKCFLLTII